MNDRRVEIIELHRATADVDQSHLSTLASSTALLLSVRFTVPAAGSCRLDIVTATLPSTRHITSECSRRQLERPLSRQ